MQAELERRPTCTSPGMLTFLLPLALWGTYKTRAQERLTAKQEERGHRRAFESNTEKTDVSEPTTAGLAWPGLSPPRHSCHFLLVLKDVLWRVWPLLTRCQQHTLL